MAKRTGTAPDTGNAEQPASFEEALSKLQEIVHELESGEQGLDESLKLYERGIASLRACHTLLDQAEQRIRKLVADAGGKVSEEPFDSEYAGETAEIPAVPGDISSGPTQVMEAVSDTESGDDEVKSRKPPKRGRGAKGSSLFND